MFITSETKLKHNQRVVFGHGNAFKVMIPLKQDEADEEDAEMAGYNAIMKDRLNSDTPMTNNIKKYLKECERRIGEEDTKKFVEMFA